MTKLHNLKLRILLVITGFLAIAVIEKNSVPVAYAKIYFQLGHEAEQTGNIKKAISFYKRSMAANPVYPFPYHRMGVIAAKTGNYQEAITYLQRAVNLSSGFREGFFELGQAYMSAKEYKRAVACFRESIRVHNDVYLYTYGVALYKSGEIPAALEIVADLLRSNREDLSRQLRDQINGYQRIP